MRNFSGAVLQFYAGGEISARFYTVSHKNVPLLCKGLIVLVYFCFRCRYIASVACRFFSNDMLPSTHSVKCYLLMVKEMSKLFITVVLNSVISRKFS